MADDVGEELGRAVVKRSTGKALLCEVEDLGTFWVPVACIHDDSEVFGSGPDNSSGVLIVKAWWARKEGLV